MNELKEFIDSNEVIERSLSYSRVSDFDRNGCKALTERTFVSGDGVKIGGLTDDLITDRILGTNIFKEKYHLFNGSKPTATTGQLADIILENYNEIPPIEEILRIISYNKFWSGTKNKKILLQRVTESDLLPYLKNMYEAKNKILITTQDLILAETLMFEILNSDNTKYIFEDEDGVDLYVQKKIKFKYKGFIFKGILDFIRVNHNDKTVEFIDLKTGKNSLIEFETSFIKWRYYLQECIYVKAFNQIKKELDLKGYKLLPFKFLYISRYEKIPFIFEVSERWSKAALKGFTTSIGYKYRGLDELLEEIRWHFETNNFDLPREIYEANGYKKLDDSFIEIK